MKDWVCGVILMLVCGFMSYWGVHEGWSVIAIVIFGLLTFYFLVVSYGSWKYDRPCYVRTDPKSGMTMTVYHCRQPGCHICED